MGKPQAMDGYVYALEFERWLKVGFSERPDVRVRQVAATLPGPISVRLVIAGTRSDEEVLHTALRPWRSRGEWYRLCAGSIWMLRYGCENLYDVDVLWRAA